MEQNCWEFKKCGRDRKNKLGVCPAVAEKAANGANNGRNGGRICWAVPGTYCNGQTQGSYAQKVLLCSTCDFRQKVQEEEASRFQVIYFRAPLSVSEVRMIDTAR